MKYSFILDGNEIGDPTEAGTGYVLAGSKIEHRMKNDNGNTAEIFVNSSVTGTVTPTVGQGIIISRGDVTATDDYIFRGEVKKVQKIGNKYTLSCKDKLNQLKYKVFSRSYDINNDSQVGEVSAIFQDIVEDGGFTASVESSGTGSSDVVLNKFISRKNTRLERMTILAQILNWHFYYDYNNDYVRLEPKGYESYGTTLEVGINIYNNPKWEVNLEKMRNKVIVEGATEIDTRVDTEVGDALTKTFNFTYRPETCDLKVDGTLQKQGVVDGSSTYDYTIDRELKTYTFVSAPGGGTSIVMTYTSRIPRPVVVTDPTSISTYGLTQEENFKFDDIVSVDDAEKRARQLLSILKDGEIKTELLVPLTNVKVGQKVTVVDASNTDFSDDYIVYDKIISYPNNFDSLKIGNIRVEIDDLFSTINERLKALEQQDASQDDLLRILIQLNHTLTLSRSTATQTKYKICDSFIVGHPVNGIIGISKALDSFVGSNSSRWSGSNFTVSDESTIKLVGANSMKLIWAGGELDGALTSTQSYGDISQYTGASSGMPAKGTVGAWVYITDVNAFGSFVLIIGSSLANYITVDGNAYASVNGYHNWDNLSFQLQNGWNYFVFKLSDCDVTGTPDWTSASYSILNFYFYSNQTIYIDYLTISESNYIGANGIGSRKMVV